MAKAPVIKQTHKTKKNQNSQTKAKTGNTHCIQRNSTSTMNKANALLFTAMNSLLIHVQGCCKIYSFVLEKQMPVLGL